MSPAHSPKVTALHPHRDAQADFYAHMATTIQRLREQQGLTHTALARKTGLPRSSLRCAETDHICSLWMAWRLSKVLEVSLDEMCNGAKEPVDLTPKRMHQLIQAVSQFPADVYDQAMELLVSTALELQALLTRHGAQHEA